MDKNYSMNNSPPIIGLMGGIGSGKSAVALLLKKYGCVVADADANAKAVLMDSDVRNQIVAWWGKEILNVDGHVDTKLVSDIVFQNEEARKNLEQLVHPRIWAMQEAQFAACAGSTRALVIDAPLLLETGADAECDYLIFVDTSREKQLERVLKTRDWTEEELDRREGVQLPLDTKRKKADYVIINEGELDEVCHQVEQILEDIHTKRFTK
jgi:dephospho-CoA kinase